MAVGGGSLHLTARHAGNSTLDQSPNGWNTHIMYDGDSENGGVRNHRIRLPLGGGRAGIRELFPHLGAHRRHHHRPGPGKELQLFGVGKAHRHSSIAQMYACDPAVKSIPLAPAEIREFGQSEDFVQYSITGITPNAAASARSALR